MLKKKLKRKTKGWKKATIHHLTQMAALDKVSPSFVPKPSVTWQRIFSWNHLSDCVSPQSLAPLAYSPTGRRNRLDLGTVQALLSNNRKCVLKMFFESQIKNIAPYRLLWRKLTLSAQPSTPAHMVTVVWLPNVIHNFLPSRGLIPSKDGIRKACPEKA